MNTPPTEPTSPITPEHSPAVDLIQESPNIDVYSSDEEDQPWPEQIRRHLQPIFEAMETQEEGVRAPMQNWDVDEGYETDLYWLPDLPPAEF